MVEYVYARHDFFPEHEDEIPFRAGERIEIIEKDELFGDGWWKGSNLAGKVGLFPESYTQPAPPPSEPPAVISPAPAIAESPLLSPPPSLPIHEPDASQPVHEPSSPLATNGDVQPNHPTSNGNGEVMLATMTDVQQAIEQLGHKDDFDGSRSFTFSSSHGESTDHEIDTDAEGEDWHKTARHKLAENAKLVAEEQAALESAEIRRSSVPPIDVEVSDDSGDEDESLPNGIHRRHSHIPEEDEEETASSRLPVAGRRLSESSSIQPSESYIVPSPAARLDSELAEDAATEGVPTATQPSFPETERHSFLPTPVSSEPSRAFSENGSDAASPSSAKLLFPSKTEAAGVLPSPAASSMGHRHGYSFGSATSSARAAAASPLVIGVRSADQKQRHVHPADWTVEEVVDWLRSKGFDEDSRKKFAEQEITGDVLLDLDVGVLKSEIGIIAYGKRMRIANAITELRRPPSVMSSSADQHTRPGSYSQNIPFPHLETAQNMAAPDSAGQISLVSPESAPDSSDLVAVSPDSLRPNSDPVVQSSLDKVNGSTATIGLGLGIPASLIPGVRQDKSVNERFTPSPSEGALGANTTTVDVGPEEEEDRAVLTESDTKKVTTKSRSQLFGRQSSASSTGKRSSSRISKEVTTPRSDITQVSDGSRPRQERPKRNSDGSREGSRLSLFGNTFTGTLGRSRKPPPRYSAAVDESPSPDRSNPLSLSRLTGTRKSSTRSSAAESNAALSAKADKKRTKRDSKDSNASKEKKDPALLRKPRSPTIPDSPFRTPAVSVTLQPGQSILAQIGTPDHSGWMRKKGEHYNTWKNRYFVLKGPHLYWLKSNAQSETKIKGYVNIVGYRIFSDESIDPGRYGFKLVHEKDRPYCFSSDEQSVIREWMKALMKATIDRDYSRPVVSSVNVPTIPLAVAQAMNPAPRPPSPTARAATQRAMKRENPNQLSTRDAEILMGVPSAPSSPSGQNGRPRVESFFNELEAVGPPSGSQSPSPRTQAPPVRPPRESRKKDSTSENPPVDPDLIEWANGHLPSTLQLHPMGPTCGGLELLRIAESIKGLKSSSVPDSAFPRRGDRDDGEDKFEGLFSLFDFLLDNDVKMGAVSINDVRQGRRDKIIQLLKALRAWDDKRNMVLQSIGNSSGPFAVTV